MKGASRPGSDCYPPPFLPFVSPPQFGTCAAHCHRRAYPTTSRSPMTVTVETSVVRMATGRISHSSHCRRVSLVRSTQRAENPCRFRLLCRDVSPDGSDFLVGTLKGASHTNWVWIVPALGGSVRRLGDAHDAAFSPDGKSSIPHRRRHFRRAERWDGCS